MCLLELHCSHLQIIAFAINLAKRVFPPRTIVRTEHTGAETNDSWRTSANTLKGALSSAESEGHCSFIHAWCSLPVYDERKKSGASVYATEQPHHQGRVRMTVRKGSTNHCCVMAFVASFVEVELVCRSGLLRKHASCHRFGTVGLPRRGTSIGCITTWRWLQGIMRMKRDHEK
jgi:hypothetical protein